MKQEKRWLAEEIDKVFGDEPYYEPGLDGDFLEAKGRDRYAYDAEGLTALTLLESYETIASTNGLKTEHITYLSVGDPDKPEKLYMVDMLTGELGCGHNDGTIRDFRTSPELPAEFLDMLSIVKRYHG